MTRTFWGLSAKFVAGFCIFVGGRCGVQGLCQHNEVEIHDSQSGSVFCSTLCPWGHAFSGHACIECNCENKNVDLVTKHLRHAKWDLPGIRYATSTEPSCSCICIDGEQFTAGYGCHTVESGEISSPAIVQAEWNSAMIVATQENSQSETWPIVSEQILQQRFISVSNDDVRRGQASVSLDDILSNDDLPRQRSNDDLPSDDDLRLGRGLVTRGRRFRSRPRTRRGSTNVNLRPNRPTDSSAAGGDTHIYIYGLGPDSRQSSDSDSSFSASDLESLLSSDSLSASDLESIFSSDFGSSSDSGSSRDSSDLSSDDIKDLLFGRHRRRERIRAYERELSVSGSDDRGGKNDDSSDITPFFSEDDSQVSPSPPATPAPPGTAPPPSPPATPAPPGQAPSTSPLPTPPPPSPTTPPSSNPCDEERVESGSSLIDSDSENSEDSNVNSEGSKNQKDSNQSDDTFSDSKESSKTIGGEDTRDWDSESSLRDSDSENSEDSNIHSDDGGPQDSKQSRDASEDDPTNSDSIHLTEEPSAAPFLIIDADVRIEGGSSIKN